VLRVLGIAEAGDRPGRIPIIRSRGENTHMNFQEIVGWMGVKAADRGWANRFTLQQLRGALKAGRNLVNCRALIAADRYLDSEKARMSHNPILPPGG